MFTGSGDFSALNMQGDMSQRNTTKSRQSHFQNETDGENSSETHTMYGVIALFVFGMFVDGLRELLFIGFILSVLLYTITPTKGIYRTFFEWFYAYDIHLSINIL